MCLCTNNERGRIFSHQDRDFVIFFLEVVHRRDLLESDFSCGNTDSSGAEGDHESFS